jgi:hypothetical protein
MRTTYLLAPLLMLAACGPTSQADARNRAADATCAFYNRCKQIGTSDGQVYATMDACVVKERSNWNDYWPASTCEGKVSDEALDVCLSAIRITECGNWLDRLNTLVNKCSKDRVCSGPAS